MSKRPVDLAKTGDPSTGAAVASESPGAQSLAARWTWPSVARGGDSQSAVSQRRQAPPGGRGMRSELVLG